MMRGIPRNSRRSSRRRGLLRMSFAACLIILGSVWTLITVHSFLATIMLVPNAHVSFVSSQMELMMLSNNRNMKVIKIGTSHFFWKGRQKRLCALINEKKSSIAPAIHTNAAEDVSFVLSLCTKCELLQHMEGRGIGNIVLGMYGVRLAAAAAGMDFHFQCIENYESTDRERFTVDVLPWMQGYFPGPQRSSSFSRNQEGAFGFSPFTPPIPQMKDVAHGMGSCPLHYMSESIRNDLRRMAVIILGPRHAKAAAMMTDPHKKSATNDFAQKLGLNPPLLPHVEVDDVAIHLRCGDVLKGIPTEDYGFIKFESYRERISPEARTIGIVTQPFEKDRNRRNDQGVEMLCKFVTMALVEFLANAFPDAVLSVRNDSKETPALAFSRLVMANQTFCGPSTFSVFPAIASFGQAYVQQGKVNYFVPPISEKYGDVEMMTGPILGAAKIRSIGFNNTVEWLLEAPAP